MRNSCFLRWNRCLVRPTQPGSYWWSEDRASRGILVEVRLIDAQLKMHLSFRDDVPVADVKRYWRGLLRPFSGPGADRRFDPTRVSLPLSWSPCGVALSLTTKPCRRQCDKQFLASSIH